jgi:thioredoxin-related protein
MNNLLKVKTKLLFFLPILLLFQNEWHNNLEEAEKIARIEHRFILLNFSGSDWCGPCIRMKKEIFESEVFKNMADTELVLVNADFPRNKKNQLSPGQQKINDEIADKYNNQGKFPYTLLLDSNGKVLQAWDGLPNESPEAFTLEVRNGMYSYR